MNQVVPEEIQKICKTFHEAGFKLYLVGGPVRDIIQNKTPKDWDFTTNAAPVEMLKLFPDAFYDNVFGTVGIPVESLKETEEILAEKKLMKDMREAEEDIKAGRN